MLEFQASTPSGCFLSTTLEQAANRIRQLTEQMVEVGISRRLHQPLSKSR